MADYTLTIACAETEYTSTATFTTVANAMIDNAIPHFHMFYQNIPAGGNFNFRIQFTMTDDVTQLFFGSASGILGQNIAGAGYAILNYTPRNGVTLATKIGNEVANENARITDWHWATRNETLGGLNPGQVNIAFTVPWANITTT